MDGGGDPTLLIHEGYKAEEELIKDGNLPDPSSVDNAECKIVLTIIRHLFESGETDKWRKIAARCKGVSEETTIGVHRLCARFPVGAQHLGAQYTKLRKCLNTIQNYYTINHTA